MARSGQTAVAVQRLGLVTKPAAPQRLRVGPRITLGIPLGNKIGAIANIGSEGNKVIRCIIGSKLTVVGQILFFKLRLVGVIFFPPRTGADTIGAVWTST